jgi:branched-chain amino acid transport system permease protein
MKRFSSDLAVGIVLFAGALLLPFIAGDYAVGVGLVLLMWLALTQSWAVLSSMTGYVSLGHVVFYGIGAYVVVVSWQSAPLALAIAAAGLASGAFAALVGMPVLRVRGPYFVILTFGLAELVKFVIIAVEAKMGIASRLLFGAPDIRDLYFAILGLAAAACIVTAVVHQSWFGHALRSIRENEEAAETVGVPIARYKLYAYVLSAIIPGMVGGVMVLRSTYFEVSQVFDSFISINIIVMAVIGGGEGVRGPLFGVLFLTTLSEALWSRAPHAYMVVLGALLILFVLKFPDGLVGWWAAQMAKSRREKAGTVL